MGGGVIIGMFLYQTPGKLRAKQHKVMEAWFKSQIGDFEVPARNFLPGCIKKSGKNVAPVRLEIRQLEKKIREQPGGFFP